MEIDIKKLAESILLVVCEKSQIYDKPQVITYGKIYDEVKKPQYFGIVDDKSMSRAMKSLIDQTLIEGTLRDKDQGYLGGYSTIKITQKGKEKCQKNNLI